jgi:anhydro-N-acetylmuramic acid kinase
MTNDLYIGLMSGTSLDGVDGVLVDLKNDQCKVFAHSSVPFADSFRQLLSELQTPGENEVHRSQLAANSLVKIYAEVCGSLLEKSGLQAVQVQAIGAHGQTVRHRPGQFDNIGYTVQINNAALLAELTGISVCADFRSRDIAAGGQGAPLVPAFHQAFFAQPKSQVCVLNLGGIANISVVSPLTTTSQNTSVKTAGFDCGPANTLLDQWCQMHTGAPYDDAGQWASSGQVIEPLLELCLSESYFNTPAPKSTGRDLFNLEWLNKNLQALQALGVQSYKPADVQATLAMLTARTCAQSVLQYAPKASALIVCGGGAMNTHLMQLLQKNLANLKVCSTLDYGLAPQLVEAVAFAWLARRCMKGQTASLPNVTGAKGARILGAIYKA